MEKTKITIKGKVAEVLELNGKKQAKVICSNENLMFTINNMPEIEFGSIVTIEGILKITSVQVEDSGIKITDII